MYINNTAFFFFNLLPEVKFYVNIVTSLPSAYQWKKSRSFTVIKKIQLENNDIL